MAGYKIGKYYVNSKNKINNYFSYINKNVKYIDANYLFFINVDLPRVN